MSKVFPWCDQSNLKAWDWVVDNVKEALTAGDISRASRLLESMNSLLTVQNIPIVIGGNSDLLEDWICHVFHDLNKGLNFLNEPPHKDQLSIEDCFKRINEFIKLNTLQIDSVMCAGVQYQWIIPKDI